MARAVVCVLALLCVFVTRTFAEDGITSRRNCNDITDKVKNCLEWGLIDANDASCMTYASSDPQLRKLSVLKCDRAFRRFQKDCHLNCSDIDSVEGCWKYQHKMSQSSTKNDKVGGFKECYDFCLTHGDECNQLQFNPTSKTCEITFDYWNSNPTPGSSNNVYITMSCVRRGRRLERCEKTGYKLHSGSFVRNNGGSPIRVNAKESNQECVDECNKHADCELIINNGVCYFYKQDYELLRINRYAASRQCLEDLK